MQVAVPDVALSPEAKRRRKWQRLRTPLIVGLVLSYVSGYTDGDWSPVAILVLLHRAGKAPPADAATQSGQPQ